MIGSRCSSARGWLLAPLLLLGCFSPQEPTRLYQLMPGEQPAAGSAAGDGGLRLAVGPVRIPDYLDRPQIVTRVSRNELQLAEFDYWAEPLSSNIQAVLAQNLLASPGVGEVRCQPQARAFQADCRVDLCIVRFEGQPEGTCLLEAEWVLSREGPESQEIRRRSVLEGRAGAGLAEVVGGLNELLGRLSDEIAEELARTFPSPSPP